MQRNNDESGLTGALLFNSKYFLQWLEGGRTAVNERFQVISMDKRHYEAEILDYVTIGHRTFDSWSMGYAGEGAMNKEVLFKYSKTSEFNPYTLSAESAVELIMQLADKSLTLEPN